MSTTVKDRARTLLTIIAGTLAIIDLVAIALLITGSQRSVGLGFTLLRPPHVFGAAEVGAALCGIVAVSAWRRPWLRRAGVVGATAMLLVALCVGSASSRRTFPAGWSAAAGLVFQLQLAGIDFGVERQSVFLFTDEFAADGTEDAELTLSTGTLHSELSARAGNVVLAATDSLCADAILGSQPHGP